MNWKSLLFKLIGLIFIALGVRELDLLNCFILSVGIVVYGCGFEIEDSEIK